MTTKRSFIHRLWIAATDGALHVRDDEAVARTWVTPTRVASATAAHHHLFDASTNIFLAAYCAIGQADQPTAAAQMARRGPNVIQVKPEETVKVFGSAITDVYVCGFANFAANNCVGISAPTTAQISAQTFHYQFDSADNVSIVTFAITFRYGGSGQKCEMQVYGLA